MADRVSTRMLLYLSVNSTPPAVSVLAPPSGTVTENMLLLQVYGTKAWLSGRSPAGFTSRCAELAAPLVVEVSGPNEVADACGVTRVAGDGTPDPPEKAAVVDTTDVAVVGGAVDVLAMTVEGGTAGEELSHAVTPTSPEMKAITVNSIRSVYFMRSP